MEVKRYSLPIIGAHVSTAGGLCASAQRARAISADAIQIFGASPRQWNARLPRISEIKKFKEAIHRYDIKAVYLHAAYLPNLATSNKDNWKKSVKNLSVHFEIAHMLSADGFIFHLGSGKDITKEEAIENIVSGMREILKNVSGKSYLVMENSAGGGDKIGSTIEDIASIFKKVKSKRVKICFDTAHAFEAGLLSYSLSEIEKTFSVFDRSVGIQHIAVIHANDSKTAFQSHHDQHENIGKGKIGISGFKNLTKERRLHHIPWLLEVPGYTHSGPDAKNIEILKSYF